MKRFRLLTTCLLAVGLFACDDEGVLGEITIPLAAIHWVHAVPDTGEMDFRVVDIVSNAGLFDAVFRGSNMFAQPIEAGSRQIRVFMSSTDPVIASTIVADTTLSLTEGAAYLFLHTGFARTGQTPARAVWVLPETPPSPAASDIGLRIIHAGAGMGDVDLHIVRRPVNAATADSLPDVAQFANVAYGAASTYVSLAADAAAADSVRVVVTTAGTKTVLASIKAPSGQATSNPIGGSRVAGTVMTAIVVPPSVAGSQAPAFATPSVVYLVERRPPIP